MSERSKATQRQQAWAWDIRRLKGIMATCYAIPLSLRQAGLEPTQELMHFLEQCSLNAGLAEDVLHRLYKEANVDDVVDASILSE